VHHRFAQTVTKIREIDEPSRLENRVNSLRQNFLDLMDSTEFSIDKSACVCVCDDHEGGQVIEQIPLSSDSVWSSAIASGRFYLLQSSKRKCGLQNLDRLPERFTLRQFETCAQSLFAVTIPQSHWPRKRTRVRQSQELRVCWVCVCVCVCVKFTAGTVVDFEKRNSTQRSNGFLIYRN
jgi:hypothetical protein